VPIDAYHPDYVAMLPKWQRCRDLYLGTDAVKAAKSQYLPVLEGQYENSASYENYRLRAMLFPAFERTAQSLAGLVFRRPPSVDTTESLEDDLADVTLQYQSFDLFAATVVQELLVTGRYGIVVDWTDAAEDEGRPYWTGYSAEQIINWSSTRIDGVETLTRVVVREDQWEESAEGKTVRVPRLREFTLEASGVRVRSYVQRRDATTGRATWTQEQQDVYPARSGVGLARLPFVLINSRRLGTGVEKPPLLDLADVNLSHYRSSADLEHGRHFVALPTPYVIGYGMPATALLPIEPVSPDPTVIPVPSQRREALVIGSGEAWIIPNPDAKVGMLEFQGAGLSALEKALEHKEQLMAILGSRLLEKQASHAETAEAVRARHAGSASAMEILADVASQGLSLALRWHAWWRGQQDAFESDDIKVQLNKDFFEAKLTAQEQEALVGLWQSGRISAETLYWNLQQGEIARPGITWDEEQEQIAEEEAEEAIKEQPEPTPLLAPGEEAVPVAGDETEDDEEAPPPSPPAPPPPPPPPATPAPRRRR
jgi:hypothetical protein